MVTLAERFEALVDRTSAHHLWRRRHRPRRHPPDASRWPAHHCATSCLGTAPRCAGRRRSSTRLSGRRALRAPPAPDDHPETRPQHRRRVCGDRVVTDRCVRPVPACGHSRLRPRETACSIPSPATERTPNSNWRDSPRTRSRARQLSTCSYRSITRTCARSAGARQRCAGMSSYGEHGSHHHSARATPATSNAGRSSQHSTSMAHVGQSPRSIHQAAVVLNTAFTWSQEQRITRANPVTGCQLPNGQVLTASRHR